MSGPVSGPVSEQSAARLAYQYVVLRCVPRVDREEFVNVGVVVYCQATDFLSGRSRAVKEELAREMEKASDDLAFERAAIYRDRLAALSAIQSPDGIAGLRGYRGSY